MTKKLQKKFVATAMLAISFLIILLLGAINITNIIIVKNDINRALDMICENALEPMKPEIPNIPDIPEGAPFREDFPRNEASRLLSSPYFTVKTDASGNILSTDLNHISSLKSSDIETLLAQVSAEKSDEGKLNKYRYKISVNRFDNSNILVFLDTSNEIYSYLRVLALSAAIGAICWCGMLLLVIFLSKKAIRPLAENIEKQKQFITNAGHEIKTPLAIIQANAEAMELYQGQSKWSNNIRQQVNRLDGLTKNLLLLARSEEGDFIPDKSDFSLSDILLKTAEDYLEPFALKGVDFEQEIGCNIKIKADKEQITQLISILLDNALKYTDSGGKVRLALYEATDRVCLNVENTVSLLPDQPPERMFERFYRADKSRNQSTGGYGIGLSVAKSLAEANNADISAEFSEDNKISFNVKF